MCEPKQGFWGDITIKKSLFWIIWTMGILGWIYFSVSFTETRAEANNTWNIVEQIREQRIENKKDNGEPVESSTKTESLVAPIKAKAEDLSSAPASGIEEIIYEVAAEKKFENPEILVRIAKAESSLNPCRKNPTSSAIGIFQILDMHGLTKDERCNPKIATEWAIDHFNNGNPWNSSRSKWDNS